MVLWKTIQGSWEVSLESNDLIHQPSRTPQTLEVLLCHWRSLWQLTREVERVGKQLPFHLGKSSGILVHFFI